MPSNDHDKGFLNLRNLIATTRNALSRNDFEDLPAILASHRNIMAELGAIGDCTDTGLLPMLTRLRDEVLEVGQEMERKCFQIQGELTVKKNKRDIARAYGK